MSDLTEGVDQVVIYYPDETIEVEDNGDGTFTVSGPDSIVSQAGNVFSINWPSALYLSETTWEVSDGAFRIGEAWNGVTKIEELSTDTVNETIFYDGTQLRSSQQVDICGLKLECITLPSDLSGNFNLCWRTFRNGVAEYHLVWNLTAKLSNETDVTLNATPGAKRYSMELVPTPSESGEMRPTAHLILSTSEIEDFTLGPIMDMLHGSDTSQAIFPTIDELLEFYDAFATLWVEDHGDGTFTITGPDTLLTTVDNTFTLTWATTEFVDDNTWVLDAPDPD